MQEIVEAFHTVIDVYTAGDPMREGVLWTNLTRSEIAMGLAGEGFPVSVTVVDKLLDECDRGQRKPQKAKTMYDDPDRNEQFERIAELRKEFLDEGLPVLSMDVKKKEILGDYVRPGRVLSNAPLRGWDHDFPTRSPGVVVPHGLYDPALNEAYLHLGDCRETSEFAIDALIDYWLRYGRARYPEATCALLLCDGGGSNGSRRQAFKKELQRAADRLGLNLRVARYPPGCSKYNPIEHRVFPHVTHKLQGLFLDGLETFRDLVRGVVTTTGLRIFARCLRGTYETARRTAARTCDDLHILFDRILPKWNYIVVPQGVWEVIKF